MEIKRELSENGELLTIGIGERFDYTKVQFFRQAYDQLPETVKHVTINLGMTAYVDSSALGMLLTMYKTLHDKQVTINLHNCQPAVLKVFNIARFDKMFSFT